MCACIHLASVILDILFLVAARLYWQPQEHALFSGNCSPNSLMAETKIIYHIDEEETPYLVKLSVAPEKVTLADFKNVLSNRPVNSYKFFFKSMDQDFG